MPRLCTICESPRVIEINLAVAMHAGSVQKIASKFRVSSSALQRHIYKCIPTLYQAMRESPAKVQGQTILKQMQSLHARTLTILSRAEASRDGDLALKAVRECRGNLEILGRLTGELLPQSQQPAGPVSIHVTYVDRAPTPALPEAKVIDVRSEAEDGA